MLQQALHIFKKDARYLRFEIAGVLAMIALFVVTQVGLLETLRRGASGVFGISEILLPAAWCFLIARAVHAEPIPGDRQFWLTRPYSRASLLLAKAIFILAFVNLPFLIAQSAILKLDAFPILSNAGALLWEQVLVTAVVTLPALVLAAVTANMIQFVVGAALMGALAVEPAHRAARSGSRGMARTFLLGRPDRGGRARDPLASIPLPEDVRVTGRGSFRHFVRCRTDYVCSLGFGISNPIPLSGTSAEFLAGGIETAG